MASAQKSSRTDGTGLPQYPIESVDNALRLLLLFGERPRVRLTEASRHLQVASSTAHRLLAMLQYRGFVRQDTDSRAYAAGPALTSVAFSVLSRLDPVQRGRPILEQLCTELDTTVCLERLEGAWVRVLDSSVGGTPQLAPSRGRNPVPAHDSAAGIAMLWELSGPQLHVLYPRVAPSAAGAAPGSAADPLEPDLVLGRERGFAVSDREGEDGVTAVAVPVPSPSGVFYAVSARVPADRLAELQGRVVESLRRAAEALSRLLF